MAPLIAGSYTSIAFSVIFVQIINGQLDVIYTCIMGPILLLTSQSLWFQIFPLSTANFSAGIRIRHLSNSALHLYQRHIACACVEVRDPMAVSIPAVELRCSKNVLAIFLRPKFSSQATIYTTFGSTGYHCQGTPGGRHIKAATLLAITLSIFVNAETHTVHFDNRCGFGTPTLIQGGRVLSTGGDFVSNGPLTAAIAYLKTGSCGFNGEGCTLIETTLVNPTSPGSGSSSDISLIPPHAFSVTSGFGYFNGCDGAGADCTNANCPTAFFNPDETFKQVACQTDNVNLAITFCD